MNENPTASEWAGERGEKWTAHIDRMEATLAPVDAPLIGALRLEAPCRVADLGCGGGATTREVLRRAPAGSVVRGFDVSPAVLESARARTPPGEPAIAFERADVGTAPAPEVPYDRLVSRFGILFFDDPPAAFAGLRRWLAPVGRFAFAAWGPAAENQWVTVVRDVVAGIVEVPQPDPGAPGAFRYAEASPFLGLLEQAGFGELDVQDWRGKLPIGGDLPAAEAASFALASFASFGELLAEKGDGALEEARRSLTARLSHYQQHGVVWMDACVHLFTGARAR